MRRVTHPFVYILVALTAALTLGLAGCKASGDCSCTDDPDSLKITVTWLEHPDGGYVHADYTIAAGNTLPAFHKPAKEKGFWSRVEAHYSKKAERISITVDHTTAGYISCHIDYTDSNGKTEQVSYHFRSSQEYPTGNVTCSTDDWPGGMPFKG